MQIKPSRVSRLFLFRIADPPIFESPDLPKISRQDRRKPQAAESFSFNFLPHNNSTGAELHTLLSSDFIKIGIYFYFNINMRKQIIQ